jgi:hypothetical protein
MGRDSNPRNARAFSGFQDRCLQPLGHPSLLRFNMMPPGSTIQHADLAPDWHRNFYRSSPSAPSITVAALSSVFANR